MYVLLSLLWRVVVWAGLVGVHGARLVGVCVVGRGAVGIGRCVVDCGDGMGWGVCVFGAVCCVAR